MSTPKNRPDPREALTDAERAASRTQPENFKEAETDEKVVEILPINDAGSAIKGIDPEK